MGVDSDQVYDNLDPSEKFKKSIMRLVRELLNRGMSRTDIASVLGVEVSVISKLKGCVIDPEQYSSPVREWVTGWPTTNIEGYYRLATLAALLDEVENSCGVSDAAAWLETPLPLPSGYEHITPLYLFMGKSGRVLDIWSMAKHPEQIVENLDEIRPEWRQERSDWEVFTDADGCRGIRSRRCTCGGCTC